VSHFALHADWLYLKSTVDRLFRRSQCVLAACCALLCCGGRAQTIYERFRSANASMNDLQPSWIGPVIQSDARLGQAMRFSVSQLNCEGAHPISYGNGHGVSVILDRRFQLDFDPPSYFRNHSLTSKDGFGNAGTQVKWRIASGNAQHGNYAVSAYVYHGFAPRAYQNGVYSTTWNPTLAAGHAFSRFALISDIGGVLPTRNLWQQGRAVTWSTTAEVHESSHVWIALENDATFNRSGPFDGKTQNFLTPEVFYFVRRRDWRPQHAIVVFDSGLQIATSRFHEYNHNLVTEMRLFF